MSKVVLFGMSPLPFENEKKAYGTGIRTWQFLMPLLRENHEVCLISYAIPSAFDSDFKSVLNKKKSYDGRSFLNHIISPQDFEDIGLLSGLVSDFSPDVIAGATFYPSFAASETVQFLRGKADLPF